MKNYTEMSVNEYIKDLENEGFLNPNCKFCLAHFYPQLKEGKKYTSIFAPRHLAMGTCQSGKHNHCTCDTCF